MIRISRHARLGLSLALVIFIADQISKYFILQRFDVFTPPLEVTPFFNLRLVWNPGVSFGMFSGLDARYPLLLFTSLIVIAVIVWLWKTKDTRLTWPLGMIIGGALGNIVDRARFGAVVDFLDVHAYGYHWPAFNIADASIVVGALLAAWYGMQEDKQEGRHSGDA